MYRIWKYPLGDWQGATSLQVEMPAGAKLLDLQLQDGTPTLWALVDPSAPVVTRTLHVIGTGWEFEMHPGNYLGTFQLAGGALVFHLFEVSLS